MAAQIDIGSAGASIAGMSATARSSPMRASWETEVACGSAYAEPGLFACPNTESGQILIAFAFRGGAAVLSKVGAKVGAKP